MTERERPDAYAPAQPARYELHFDQLEEKYAILRTQILGEFASREAAREWMIATEADRALESPPPAPRIDPFVFVAATRYAINRTLTSASQVVAGQIEVHAAVIARDAGATGAIQDAIEEFARREQPGDQGAAEWEAIQLRWLRAGEKLEEARRVHVG